MSTDSPEIDFYVVGKAKNSYYLLIFKPHFLLFYQ